MHTVMKKTNGYVPASTFSGLIDRVFPNNTNRSFDDHFWGFNGIRHAGAPPVNIRETPDGYELQVVAPGLKKEDLKVSVNNDVLMISFRHEESNTEQGKQDGWLRKEYNSHSFMRSFDLEGEIDTTKIAAKYADGILHLTLPKKDGGQAATHTIEIQ